MWKVNSFPFIALDLINRFLFRVYLLLIILTKTPDRFTKGVILNVFAN